MQSNKRSYKVGNTWVKLYDFNIIILVAPTAIYRDDLSSDYVAYWVVEFNSSQYAVVSA